MPITLAVDAPSGAKTEYHVISRFEASFTKAVSMVYVLSFAHEAAYLAGATPIQNTPIMVPVDACTHPIEDALHTWVITAAESPFKGGLIVPDNAQTLEAAKARAWSAIKVARDAAEFGPFLFDGGLYDADKERIIGAVQMATLAQLAGEPFSITWTLADNSTRVLDGAQMIGLGLALGAHIAAAHDTARALRVALAEADSIEAVSAIGWPA